MVGHAVWAEVLEEALPEGMVDAHHHVWDLKSACYPWLQGGYLGDRFFLGAYDSICKDYSIAELRRDLAPIRLRSSVHIEAERDPADQVGETRWLESVNLKTSLPSVIIGHVSFLQADLNEVLAAHRRSSLFRGVRSKPLTSERGGSVKGKPGSMQDDRWLTGLAKLEDTGLSWDLRVPFWHLEEAAAVVAAFPRIPVALNHCGLPLDRSDDGLSQWRRGLEALAVHPNVFIKLSEFGLKGGRWDDESTTRVVRDAVKIFGYDRLMFGSNLPVSSLSAPISRIVSAVMNGLETVDNDIIRGVFALNATLFYRIYI